MIITNVKIDELKQYDNNAKKHDKTQIDNVAESIKQCGCNYKTMGKIHWRKGGAYKWLTQRQKSQELKRSGGRRSSTTS